MLNDETVSPFRAIEMTIGFPLVQICNFAFCLFVSVDYLMTPCR
jgi:hypothetical protein